MELPIGSHVPAGPFRQGFFCFAGTWPSERPFRPAFAQRYSVAPRAWGCFDAPRTVMFLQNAGLDGLCAYI